MASGFCVRVLLLSLLAFSKYAEALAYRSSYSSGIKPYFGMAEHFPHNHKPVSRHKSAAQHRSSLGVYGPEHGSPENSYPTAAGGAGASSGRPLNGYLQQGSVSSYRSSSSQPYKPSHYQGDTNGVLQSKDAMWDLAPSQKRNRTETGIVSSYAIVMRSEPQRQSNEHQTQPHNEREQFSDESNKFQPRPQPHPLPQQPRYEASKPHALARPFPQQPHYEASKPQARALVRLFPQQPHHEASKPQARALARPFPQQPHHEASKPQARALARPFPQQPRHEASKPQARALAWPFPQQLRYKASKPQAQPHHERERFSDESRKFQPLPQPQAQPFPQWPRYEASKPQAQPFPQWPRYEASKPQAQLRSEAKSPSEGVLQTKAGMWDLAINSNAGPRSFRPIPVSSRGLYRWPQQQAPFYNRY